MLTRRGKRKKRRRIRWVRSLSSHRDACSAGACRESQGMPCSGPWWLSFVSSGMDACKGNKQDQDDLNMHDISQETSRGISTSTLLALLPLRCRSSAQCVSHRRRICTLACPIAVPRQAGSDARHAAAPRAPAILFPSSPAWQGRRKPETQKEVNAQDVRANQEWHCALGPRPGYAKPMTVLKDAIEKLADNCKFCGGIKHNLLGVYGRGVYGFCITAEESKKIASTVCGNRANPDEAFGQLISYLGMRWASSQPDKTPRSGR